MRVAPELDTRVRRAASLTSALPSMGAVLAAPALPQLGAPAALDAAQARTRAGLEALFAPAPPAVKLPLAVPQDAQGCWPPDTVLAVLERLQDQVAAQGVPASRGVNGEAAR